MHIDSTNRTIRLSVGELASFRSRPSEDKKGGNLWRATVGQEWHKIAEKKTRAQYPEAEFEVPINGRYLYRDWIFEINGRIDQVILTASNVEFVEIKTIRQALPDAVEELSKRYTDYFAQIATYYALAEILPEYDGMKLQAVLTFINIENGCTQSVPLDKTNKQRFKDQLDALIPFIEDRRETQLRLSALKIRPAFDTLRDGQAELFEQLERASIRNKTVLLEAPTGFGKTGIVLEHALRQLKNGIYERCIYLTSKSTGQIETVRKLSEMAGDSVRFLQMRNRTEHSIRSTLHTCTGDERCNDEIGQKWFEADIRSPELFQEGTLSLDRAKEIGSKTGICPYALSKSCLPFAEFWIGDSNYIFSPSSQSTFMEAFGFDAKKTLLIVDEAHNLPDRTADALSVTLRLADFIFALEELQTIGAPRRLLSIGNAICRFIESLPCSTILSTNAIYEGLDLCEDFSKQLQEAPLDYESLAPFAKRFVWQIPEMAQRLNEPSHQWLHWCPEQGVISATCLDASNWISECIQPFGGTILMSATLSPVEQYRETCGLTQNDSTCAVGHAKWRENAYDVAIDVRVNTRLKERSKHYETTASTIVSLIQKSPGSPIAVFFSSYQYAENVNAYLSTIGPEMRIQIQPRGVDLKTQENFIDEGLLTADALFLILGSGYAEGIDKLGGRIHSVMVVGQALPEVNLVQQAKMEAYPGLSRELAFRDVYLLQGMRRIHQALGRIVRAPEHRAKVLLHGKRYAETAYMNQLADEYKNNATRITSNADLIDWLNT